MKRLSHPEINTTIEFEENKINSIVIENRDFFRRVVTELIMQADGSDGTFVLSEEYTPIEISKNAEILTQFVPFEINKKNIIGKICDAATKEALNESNFARTQELLSAIERYMNELLFGYSYDFEFGKLNVESLIKSVGIVINEEYDNGLEKLLDYMQLVREFDRERIFIFVNLRSYYSDREMEFFVRDVASRKFYVLLIDNTENERLSNEKRLIIDSDLCEIF